MPCRSLGSQSAAVPAAVSGERLPNMSLDLWSGKTGRSRDPRARRPAGDSVALPMDGMFQRDGQPGGGALVRELLGRSSDDVDPWTLACAFFRGCRLRQQRPPIAALWLHPLGDPGPRG